MISSWVVKILVGIAVAAFVLVELGSPLIARAQVDEAAHEVADEAALELGRGARTLEQVQAKCVETAADSSVELLACDVDPQGRVAVTVRKDARSFLLNKISVTKGWYDAKASATAVPKQT